MTVVTKDKGKRRKEFDKDRLIAFIQRGIKATYKLDVEKFVDKVVGAIEQRSEIAATEITTLLTLNSLEMVGEPENENEKINLRNLDWRFFARYVLQMELYKRASKNRAYDAADKYGDYYGNLKVLVDKGLYDPMLLVKYSKEEIKSLGGLIDPSKDELFDYAGLRALRDRYLVKDYDGSIYELPQERWLTISMTLMQDEDKSKRTFYVMEMYHALSNLYLTVATPTMANAGRPNPQLASCQILTSEDSLEGIYNDNTDIAKFSKWGAGIGAYVGKLRGKGSNIRGFKGVSSGCIPWIKQLDNTAVSVNQLGVRAGSVSVWLDVWHRDIKDFLDLKLNTGDQSQRAHNIFPAVCLPDLFMQRVKSRGDWYLFDPHEVKEVMGFSIEDYYDEEIYDDKGKPDPVKHAFSYRYDLCVQNNELTRERIPAIEIMKSIMKSQIETGTPYHMLRDTVNRANPNKHAGMVYSSNLCVTGDQLAVTSGGIIRVKDLYESGESLTLFDGDKAVKASPMRLVEKDADVYEVITFSGRKHKITGYHKLKTERGMVDCSDLVTGDRVVIQRNKGLFGDVNRPREAFLLGLFHADGTVSTTQAHIDIWENDFGLTEEVTASVHALYREYDIYHNDTNKPLPKFKPQLTGDSEVGKLRLSSTFLYKSLAFRKGVVPDWILKADEKTQGQYLRGLYIGDGTARIQSDANGSPLYLSLCSVDKEFLEKIQIILSNLGINGKIYRLRDAGTQELPNHVGGVSTYNTKACWRLNINSKNDALRFNNLTGFLDYKGITLEDRVYRDNTMKFDVITEINYVGKEDVYCTTVESEEHVWVCNSFVTSNCSEITQNQSPSYVVEEFVDEEGYIVTKKHAGDLVTCNLSSLVLDRIAKSSKATSAIDFDVKAKELLNRIISIQMRALDNVISLNHLPVPAALVTNTKYRAVGAGEQGVAALLALLGIQWDSDEASAFVNQLEERINFYTVSASMRLSSEKGSYPLFQGSEWQTGEYFERRGYGKAMFTPKDLDWNQLRLDVSDYGVRNSYMRAVAPTGGTSVIAGSTPGIDPIFDVLYYEKKKDFIIPIVVPHLDSKTWWRYKPTLRMEFEGENELAHMHAIKMQEARTRHIDQSASFNLYIPDDIKAKNLLRLHMEVWERGIKTSYYTRSWDSRSESNCLSCES